MKCRDMYEIQGHAWKIETLPCLRDREAQKDSSRLFYDWYHHFLYLCITFFYFVTSFLSVFLDLCNIHTTHSRRPEYIGTALGLGKYDQWFSLEYSRPVRAQGTQPRWPGMALWASYMWAAEQYLSWVCFPRAVKKWFNKMHMKRKFDQRKKILHQVKSQVRFCLSTWCEPGSCGERELELRTALHLSMGHFSD